MLEQKISGIVGELKIRAIMAILLGSGYKKFHNVTVELSENKTSQIDHVVVSVYGIFVIETKNYRGRIGIDEHGKNWTQNFSRHSYDFYNPIKQNEGHIRAMKYLLKNKDYPYFNIVSFVGEASFIDNELPEGVAKSIWSTVKLLRKKRAKKLSKYQVEQIADEIKKRRMPNNRRTHKRHLANIKAAQARHARNQE